MNAVLSVLSIESVILFVTTLIIVTRIQYSRAQVYGYYADQPLWNGSSGTLIVALLLPFIVGFILLFSGKQDQDEFAVVPAGLITAAVFAMSVFKTAYPKQLPVMYDISADEERSMSHIYFFIYVASLFVFIAYAKERLLLYPLGIGFALGYLSYYYYIFKNQTSRQYDRKQYDDGY
jgi:hypothetical protein